MPLPPDSCRCDEQEACDADATQVVASEQRGIPEPVLEHPKHQYCIRCQYRAESARRSDTTIEWGSGILRRAYVAAIICETVSNLRRLPQSDDLSSLKNRGSYRHQA